MAIVRRAKSDASAVSVTSDYGSGCDVTCDSKSRRVNHDHSALDDITSERMSAALFSDYNKYSSRSPWLLSVRHINLMAAGFLLDIVLLQLKPINVSLLYVIYTDLRSFHINRF